MFRQPRDGEDGKYPHRCPDCKSSSLEDIKLPREFECSRGHTFSDPRDGEDGNYPFRCPECKSSSLSKA
jgi:predicted Zn-ribbon and HTH transcriptional regulator